MKAFVLMPFSPELNRDYREIFRPALEHAKYTVHRADDLFTPRPIILDIQQSITEANLILCEMTGRNPNVFYELGLAHALGKPAILLSRREEDIPFDLRHIRVIIYEKTSPNWKEKLRSSITAAANAVKNSAESWPQPLSTKEQKVFKPPPATTRPSDHERVPGVTGDLVFNMKCNAKENSGGTYDSPPEFTTFPYPYAFGLDTSAECTLVVEAAIWAASASLVNVVEVLVDGRVVGSTRQKKVMNHQFIAHTTLLGAGRHEIEFQTHYENDDRSVNQGDSKNYWMLRSVRVFADEAQP